MMTIIDAHSHLWLKQDTSWNGMEIRSLKNGRSIFLGEEVQMIPPFIIDSVNSAEVFLSNMDYAQVTAAVVVQELIDGNQNDYLIDVAQRYPDRFIVCGMFDYFGNNILEEVRALIDRGFKGIAIPGHRLITDDRRVMLNSPEMIAAFKLMEEKDVFLSITLADGAMQVGELQEVIEECPKLRIAIGHFGMPTI
ncbi:MAG: amidohydrolase, partial [Prevotella sp.]|nr:amidohydrolase [Prevotella sp.]